LLVALIYTLSGEINQALDAGVPADMVARTARWLQRTSEGGIAWRQLLSLAFTLLLGAFLQLGRFLLREPWVLLFLFVHLSEGRRLIRRIVNRVRRQFRKWHAGRQTSHGAAPKSVVPRDRKRQAAAEAAGKRGPSPPRFEQPPRPPRQPPGGKAAGAEPRKVVKKARPLEAAE
jgi:hypothetical protein